VSGIPLLILISSYCRVILVTRKHYKFGYNEHKKRFTIVFANMCFWALASVLRDAMTSSYEVCAYQHNFHEKKDIDCSELLGQVFVSNLGYWIWLYPMKLPYLTFALCDSATDILVGYNRYPEVVERVSTFQYKKL